MRAHRKKIQKRNIFEDDSQQQQTTKIQNAKESNEKPKSQKMIERVHQMYNAAKIEENEHYIGGKKEEEQFKNDQEIEKKSKKKMMKNRTRKLFDESDQDQDENFIAQNSAVLENRKLSKESIPIEKNNKKDTKNIDENKNEEYDQRYGVELFEDSLEDTISQEQQNIQQKIKRTLAELSVHKDTPPFEKQISFSRLVEEAGADNQELKNLLYQPIPKGYKAVCIFKKLPTRFQQSFQLLLEDNQRSILFCENQRGSIGANYYISLTKEMDKKLSSYLGKLRGNSTGSVYQLYDCGKQPDKNIDRENWRISMARIQYQTNFMGMNGPRKLKVAIPKICKKEEVDLFRLKEGEDLSKFQFPVVLKYRNKEPKWNQRLKSYALNFGGRVKQASIKNFILVDQEVPQEIQHQAPNALVFGKVKTDIFSLEVIYPLSLYQAFGIVLSEFDFKLNCQ